MDLFENLWNYSLKKIIMMYIFIISNARYIFLFGTLHPPIYSIIHNYPQLHAVNWTNIYAHQSAHYFLL